jgi:hypothetical protein
MTPAQRESLTRESREAMGDMATFARVLEATRANLNVMNRLRSLRAGQRDYTDRDVRESAGKEILRGND